MGNMSRLLSHPQLIEGEGVQGFRLRLANANGLDASTLKAIGVYFSVPMLKAYRCLPDESSSHSLVAYATYITQQWDTRQPIWNLGNCRCCPICLREGGYWRVEWELLFFDVCATHGCWLIDHCDRCGSAITWRRQSLMQCDCGHLYANSNACEAPASSLSLACDLQRKFIDQNVSSALLPLKGLNFEQTTRLIRFLGTYSQSQVGRLPQKVQNLGAMDVSWQVTSIAAEIFNQWPTNFERVLHAMLVQTSGAVGQRFSARFGFFYVLLYRRFNDPEFASLRTAFEDFIAEHWQGPIAKRHKRLHEAMLERATWLPASHARRQLQVSLSRLTELVRTGAVIGEERLTAKGRRFLVVHRDSLLSMRPALNDELDLSTCSGMLGLTRARLRSALTLLFPNARKVEGDANRWAISRADVEAFILTCNVPAISKVADGQVSMDHILRFWCCSEEEIASLLVNLRNGVLQPIGRLSLDGSVSRLVLNEAHARQLVDRGRSKHQNKWTIPQVAEVLDVKQEVAYFLVRQGLLATKTEVIGRREAAMVTREDLDAFRARYVFARDLARIYRTSSRSLQSRLAEINIHPVVSPLLGVCRQVIYQRTSSLDKLFPQTDVRQNVVAQQARNSQQPH